MNNHLLLLNKYVKEKLKESNKKYLTEEEYMECRKKANEDNLKQYLILHPKG